MLPARRSPVGVEPPLPEGVMVSDDLERLRQINELLKRALELVQQELRRKAELANSVTGQDNDPDESTEASPPSA